MDMEYHQFAMYSFSGFGMCLINIIFTLNSSIHISTTTKTYDVISIEPTSQGIEVVLSGEGGNGPFERNVANFIYENFPMIPEGNKMTVTVNKGLFGFDMVKDCKITNAEKISR
jgi:hypothetical protein